MIELKNVDHWILKEAYNFYKKTGFPFVCLTPHELLIDFKKLMESKPKITKRYDYKGQLYYSVGTGLAGIEFCKHFMPHQYTVKVFGSMGSPTEAFEKRRLLRKSIKMAYQYSGKITDTSVRSYLSRIEWHQFATNFRPAAAKAIYERYLRNGSVAYDFCAGFGGRLSGFLANKYARTSKYIGVDPSTPAVDGLNNMIGFLHAKNKAVIHKTVAEAFCPDELHGTVDLAFSSPPYFCKELYSEDSDQSFKKYPTYDLWRIFFLRKTIKNCHKLLKPGGHFIINIADVNIKGSNYPCGRDAERFGTKIFGKLKEVLALPMNSLFGCEDTPKKMEKIYVFQKV